MIFRAEPLTAEAFSPFGGVIQTPPSPGERHYFDGPLANLRPHAKPSLSVAYAKPVDLPLAVTMMERHCFSSQSFIPMAPTPWLVIVAPDDAEGGPLMRALRVFQPDPGTGITLAPGCWHFPLTVLEYPAAFTLTMWRDGSPDDEELRDVAPVTVTL